jgi:alkylation response protein AidB-like acyl-CoA dehydrogenase
VRFAFTAEQLAIRDSVRALLARECPAGRVREAWSNTDGRVPGLWAKLGELGVPGMLAPEAHGGLGLTELDLVLVLEESGRFAVPEPILETAAVGVPLLRDAVGAEPGAGWLRAAAAGQAILSVKLQDAPYVAGAEEAHLLLAEHSGTVHALERGAFFVERRGSVDGSRRLAHVEWSPTTATCIADGAKAARLLADARDRAAVASAAQLVGLARAMLEAAVAYVKARHQFGKPVGSFQAVKHHLADALISIEMAAPAVYRAAYSLAHSDSDRSTHASMAKALASDAAALVARKALQCHGAIGYAFENDLQLWMKRAWALSAAWGDAAWHRDRVGRAILGAAARGGV